MTFSHYSAEENNKTVGQSEIQSKKELIKAQIT